MKYGVAAASSTMPVVVRDQAEAFISRFVIDPFRCVRGESVSRRTIPLEGMPKDAALEAGGFEFECGSVNEVYRFAV